MSQKNSENEIREIVYCQDEDKCFGDIFVYEPENVEEKALGTLFIIGELQDLPRDSAYVINLLASKIRKEFYADRKRDTEAGLEAALVEANAVLEDMRQQGSDEYVGKLNMACGACRDQDFFISQVGKVRSVLVREGRASEVIDTTQQPTKHLFENIASGKLKNGDLIIVGTPQIFELFSLEKLELLYLESDIDHLAEHIQAKIEAEKIDLASALLLQAGESAAIKAPTVVPIGLSSEDVQAAESSVTKPEEEAETSPVTETEAEDQKSQANAESEAEETVKKMDASVPLVGLSAPTATPLTSTVTPPEINDVKQKSLEDLIKEYEKEEKEAKEATPQKSINETEASSVPTEEETTSQEDTAAKGSKTANKFFHLVKEKRAAMPKLWKKFPAQSARALSTSPATHKLPLLPGKRLALGAIVLLLAGVAAYSMLHSPTPAVDTRRGEYETLLSEAKRKIQTAQVDSINTETETLAGENLLAAVELAEKVKREYDGLDGEAEKIIAEAETELDRLEKVSRVDAPTVLAQLKTNTPKRILKEGENHYIIDLKNPEILKLDSAAGSLQSLKTLSDFNGDLTAAVWFSSQEIILTDGKTFVGFNLKTNQPVKLSAESITGFVNFRSYGSNLYFLDSSSHQIYKVARSGNRLSTPVAWLKDSPIASDNNIDLAVDSNIYTVTPSGKVSKFFSGKEWTDAAGKNFTAAAPLRPFQNVFKIATEANQKYLYLAEPDRIAVMEKSTGKLVKQFKGEMLQDLQDFTVDAKEQTLTAINAKAVFSFNLAN